MKTYEMYSGRAGNGRRGQRRSADEIERDVGSIRSEMSDTLRAIESKFGGGDVVGKVISQLRGGEGADTGELLRNLGTVVRQNPLPVALIASGIGAMFLAGEGGTNAMGGRVRHRAHDRVEQFRSDRAVAREEREARMAEAREARREHALELRAEREARLREAREAREARGLERRERADERRDELRGRAEDFRGRAYETGEHLRDRAHETREQLRGRAHERGEHLRSRAHDLRESAGKRYDDARLRARDRGEHARESMRHGSDRAREGIRGASQQGRRVVEDEPLVLAGLGLALGAAIAASIPLVREGRERRRGAREYGTVSEVSVEEVLVAEDPGGIAWEEEPIVGPDVNRPEYPEEDDPQRYD